MGRSRELDWYRLIFAIIVFTTWQCVSGMLFSTCLVLSPYFLSMAISPLPMGIWMSGLNGLGFFTYPCHELGQGFAWADFAIFCQRN